MASSYCGTVWCILSIIVDDRRVFALHFQDRVWHRVFYRTVSCFQHPLCHLTLSIAYRASSIECSLATITVQQQSVTFKAVDELLLHCKCAIIFVNLAISTIRRIVTIVIIVWKTTMYIVDFYTAIDRRNITAFDYITIKHAVHHHCGKRSFCRGYIVIAHDTAFFCSSRDVGVAETVDDTGCTVKKTHQAACISRTAHRTAQDTTVKYSGSTNSTRCDSPDISGPTTDIDIVKHHIAHSSSIDAIK